MELLLFFLLTLLSEIMGTIGGFGSSVFFVSIGQFFYSFQAILALTGILHVFSNTSRLLFFWKTIHWKLVLTIGLSSVILAIAGALLTRWIEFTYANLLLYSRHDCGRFRGKLFRQREARYNPTANF